MKENIIDNDFLLMDRIQKIKSMNELYDLEHNSYISFSGGKDSTVLHHLIDEALPGNKIPRVYINTGIEYRDVVAFVERERERDYSRFEIIKPQKNIRAILEEFGYPFKSKEYSLYLSVYQSSGECKSVTKYLSRHDSRFACPDRLKYQFTPDFNLHVSNKCCYKLKKDVAERWRKDHHKTITMTGMRANEGGLRAGIKGCAIFHDKALTKFHPLLPLTDDFIDWYIKERGIKLCRLYYPPFNFERTGCKGCPYSLDLQKQLDIMAVYLPEERKQCERIWSEVYKEYRRIHYRLEPTLFDDL